MTKKQALDYFWEDVNWETVERGVKGMMELQRHSLPCLRNWSGGGIKNTKCLIVDRQNVKI